MDSWCERPDAAWKRFKTNYEKTKQNVDTNLVTRNAGSVTMSGPTRTSETESRTTLQNNVTLDGDKTNQKNNNKRKFNLRNRRIRDITGHFVGINWRIRPCSMKVMAVFRFWAMRRFSMMLGSLLLQESQRWLEAQKTGKWYMITSMDALKSWTGVWDDLPAEWRRCDFLCEGQVLSGGEEADTVPYVKKQYNYQWYHDFKQINCPKQQRKINTAVCQCRSLNHEASLTQFGSLWPMSAFKWKNCD